MQKTRRVDRSFSRSFERFPLRRSDTLREDVTFHDRGPILFLLLVTKSLAEVPSLPFPLTARKNPNFGVLIYSPAVHEQVLGWSLHED